MTPAARTHSLREAVSGLEPISLTEVLESAARLTRIDRKYLVDRRSAEALLLRLGHSYRVLSIQGRRWTSYRSTYFDTADLASCRAHVQQRRRRWKARSRLYVEDQLCRIEVKTKDGNDATVKSIGTSHPLRYGRLEGTEAGFVSDALARYGAHIQVGDLQPSMEVSYRRVTLADPASCTRITVDDDVHSVLESQQVWIDPEFVVIETKGDRRPSEADRILKDLGARPRSFSKYVSAASLLRDDIPDNDVRAMRGRVLHTAPLPSHGDAA